MKRLLCIVGGMNIGGAETFLMKIYRKLDKSQYQIDFAVGIEGAGAYDDEILSMGGRIFHIIPKSSGLIKNFNSIKQLVKREQYKYVLRISQNSMSALELLASKLGGAKVNIFRSSNSNSVSGNRKEKIIHAFFKFMPRLFANVKIAPSTEAAEFMFGKDCIKKGKAQILPNGIDLDYYKHDEEARLKLRQQFKIENKFVIGHIGRFNQQKNHKFLIEIFDRIQKLNDNSVLLLVGMGELENKIRKKVSEFCLTEKVIFAGVRSDIPALLSTMDVFIFPSFYEGMPNTVIEAQATGVPCIISDKITREAALTKLVQYKSLEDSPESWAETALNFEATNRISCSQILKDKGYDITDVTETFTNLIFEREQA